MRIAPRLSVDESWKSYRDEVFAWDTMDDQYLLSRVGVYAASAYVREDAAMRNRQKVFSQWTDLAFAELGSSRVFRFVRGPQAAARFLCVSPYLTDQKLVVAQTATVTSGGGSVCGRLSADDDARQDASLHHVPMDRTSVLPLHTTTLSPVPTFSTTVCIRMPSTVSTSTQVRGCKTRPCVVSPACPPPQSTFSTTGLRESDQARGGKTRLHVVPQGFA